MTAKKKIVRPFILTSVRFPPDVHVAASKAAAETERSLNSLVIYAVRELLKRGEWLDQIVEESRNSADDGK